MYNVILSCVYSENERGKSELYFEHRMTYVNTPIYLSTVAGVPPHRLKLFHVVSSIVSADRVKNFQRHKPINPDLCFQNLNVSLCENLNSCQVKMFHLQISTPRSRLVLNHLLFLSNSSPFFSTHKALLWMSCLIWRLHYASILFTILFVWLNIWSIDAAWLNYE